MQWFKNIFFNTDIARLSDEEYAELARRARVRRGDAAWALPMAAGVGMAIAWLLLVLMLSSMARGAYTAAGGAAFVVVTSPAGVSTVVTTSPIDAALSSWWGVNLVLSLLIAAAGFAGVRHTLISQSISHLIVRASCPYCEFSLVGLAIDATNAVVCPECGERVHLHEHRISREDVEIAPREVGAGPRGAYKDLPVSPSDWRG